MKTIWKFRLEVQYEQEIRIPVGAEIMCVGVQYDYVHLWAMVDDDAKPETRRILMIGTGHPIRKDERIAKNNYIGTIQLRNGDLVFHVFDGTGAR